MNYPCNNDLNNFVKEFLTNGKDSYILFDLHVCTIFLLNQRHHIYTNIYIWNCKKKIYYLLVQEVYLHLLKAFQINIVLIYPEIPLVLN